MSTATLLSPWKIDEPPPVPVRRFTVDEYQRMAQLGILTENDRVELLEGWIVSRMTQNPPHGGAVDLLEEAIGEIVPSDWRTRTHRPVTTPDSEPEPDLVVVKGDKRSFTSRHPLPNEVGLVAEDSDSSLATDRGIKAKIYARAGIPCYWIVNLIDRRLEVLTNPSGPADAPAYAQKQVLGPMTKCHSYLMGRKWGESRSGSYCRNSNTQIKRRNARCGRDRAQRPMRLQHRLAQEFALIPTRV